MWILYDYLRLEWLPPGSPGGTSGIAALGGVSGRSGIRSLGAASVGRSAGVAADGVGNGTVTVGGLSYAVLSYDHEDPVPEGVHYVVEVSPDLVRWTEAGLAVIADERRDGRRWITVQDTIPLGLAGPRYLRVRLVTEPVAY